MVEYRHRHIFGRIGIECIVRENGLMGDHKVVDGCGYLPAKNDWVIVQLDFGGHTYRFEEGLLKANGHNPGAYRRALDALRREIDGPHAFKRCPLPNYLLATLERGLRLSTFNAQQPAEAISTEVLHT